MISVKLYRKKRKENVMRVLRILALCLGIILVATASIPAYASTCAKEYTAPSGVTILTDQEIRDKVVGNTVDGWPQFRIFFHADGTMEFLSRGLNFGKWRTCGNVFIMEGSQLRERTLAIREEGKLSFYDLAGKHQGTYPLKRGKAF